MKSECTSQTVCNWHIISRGEAKRGNTAVTQPSQIFSKPYLQEAIIV